LQRRAQGHAAEITQNVGFMGVRGPARKKNGKKKKRTGVKGEEESGPWKESAFLFKNKKKTSGTGQDQHQAARGVLGEIELKEKNKHRTGNEKTKMK